MSDEQLSDFTLVGGTNLALQIGHRKSIDLDLFANKGFETEKFRSHLCERYDFQEKLKKERNTIMGYIAGVKIDMIAHIYPLLREPIVEDGIRMYALPDIAAMKLCAICDSGSRLKDFVDIAYLSTRMSLFAMMTAYTAKYSNVYSVSAVRALLYYKDIDFTTPIDLCNGKTFEWDKIEQRIREMVKYETKIFEAPPV